MIASHEHAQAILYARDLARLYERVRDQEVRLAEHRARLARELARATGSASALVLVRGREGYGLLASHGLRAAVAPLEGSLVEALGDRPGLRAGEPWASLGLGAEVLALPIGGCPALAVGLVPASAATPSLVPALELFSELALLLLDERRPAA